MEQVQIGVNTQGQHIGDIKLCAACQCHWARVGSSVVLVQCLPSSGPTVCIHTYIGIMSRRALSLQSLQLTTREVEKSPLAQQGCVGLLFD